MVGWACRIIMAVLAIGKEGRMNVRENALAIYNGEQPDYYFDFMDSLALVPDPMMMADVCPQDGLEHKDTWGVTKVFPLGAPGAHPHITEENKVLKDILDWREVVKAPPVKDLDWSVAKQVAAGVNRDEMFLGYFCPTGLFERSHFLMGMEDAFCAYLEEPEEMFDMLTMIKNYKLDCINEAAKQIHPDVIFYHDDWASKTNLFLPPDVWREIIKPLQTEIADCIHECGMIYVHHSDCYCAPIVEDMVELGIDIWQGVIPQNPIPEIQERTRENCSHQLRMIGGIDGPALDIEHITEEEIRAAVRESLDRCLPGGYFYPAIPNGQCFREWNDGIVKDEMKRYGRQWAAEHPIGDVVIDTTGMDFSKAPEIANQKPSDFFGNLQDEAEAARE